MKKGLKLFIFLPLILLVTIISCRSQEAILSQNNFYVIKSRLIPQEGNFSCWAATLAMLDEKTYTKLNKIYTSPIRMDSLKKYLESYQNEKYAKISDPSWSKIKENLIANQSLITYKYYNEKFAHVFLVRGFEEAQNTKWLLVNDPWPVNKAKITALAFNQFIRPFNGSREYSTISYSPSSNSNYQKTEPIFNIFSEKKLKDNLPMIYTPPLVKINPKKPLRINPKNIENLVEFQVNLFKSFNSKIFEEMKIDYNPLKDNLNKDLNSLITLNQFTNTLSFLKYDLRASQRSDYVFDGLKLAFVNIDKNRKPIINITIEYENKSAEPFLYVSRFEKYSTSERAEWDQILLEFMAAQNNPTIKAILNGKSSSQKNKGPHNFESSCDESIYEIEDIAMLPLFGGMIYSFTWPPFTEKIVADPYKQLKLKPNKEAIFISDSDIPFYRLSSIAIPEWGEIIPKNLTINEEWVEQDRTNFFDTNKIPPIKPSGKDIISGNSQANSQHNEVIKDTLYTTELQNSEPINKPDKKRNLNRKLEKLKNEIGQKAKTKKKNNADVDKSVENQINKIKAVKPKK